MKALAGLVLAVVMSMSVVSAGEFDGVLAGKTSLILLKDFQVKTIGGNVTASLVLKSKENGKICEWTYPTIPYGSYTMKAGSRFFFNDVAPSGSIPGVSLLAFLTMPNDPDGYATFHCLEGLSLTQIQNMLMEAGLELQDAL